MLLSSVASAIAKAATVGFLSRSFLCPEQQEQVIIYATDKLMHSWGVIIYAALKPSFKALDTRSSQLHAAACPACCTAP